MFFEIAYKIVNIRILYQIAIYIGIFIAYVALETSLEFDDISPRGKQWLTPLAMTGWLFSIYEGFFSKGSHCPIWLLAIDSIFVVIVIIKNLPLIKRGAFMRSILFIFVSTFGFFLIGLLIINFVTQFALFIGILVLGIACLALFAFTK